MTAGRADQPLVLVLEDDEGVRDLIETVLTADGFAVHSVGDGREGLAQLEALAPAVLVTDVMMPGLGGLGVLDELAAHHADLPVIVLTGRDDAADEARRRIGAANVFDKPFDLDELVRRLAEITGMGAEA